MALLYRAIWRDARPDLFAAGEATFVDWLRDRDLGLEVPRHGTGESEDAVISVARVDDGPVQALRMSLHKESAVRGGSERRTTTAHWMTDGSEGWAGSTWSESRMMPSPRDPTWWPPTSWVVSWMTPERRSGCTSVLASGS